MIEQLSKNTDSLKATNGTRLVRFVAKQIRDARAKNAFARILVVTPTLYSAFYLRRAVTDYICQTDAEGLFNIEFVRIEEVADRLFDATPDRPHKESMTRLIASELIHNAMSQLTTPGPLTEHAGNDSALEAVQRTLQELERLDMGAAQALQQLAKEPLYRQLMEIYRRYSSVAGKYVTRENKADIAARTVTESPDLVHLALAPKVLMIRTPRLPDAYSSLRDNLEQLPDTVTIRVSHELGEGDEGNDDTTQETRFYSSLGAMDEPRGLIRNIVADARAGIRFGEMAVLYPSKDYASRIKDALNNAGIANCGPSSRTLRDTSAGRFVSLFLDMVADEMRRDAFTAWTTSSPVTDPVTHDRVLAVQWEVASRNARVSRFSNDDRWQHSLQRYSNSMRNRAERAEKTLDEDNAVDPESWRSMAAAAAGLINFVSNLTDRTSIDDPKSWYEWVDWITGIINDYLSPASLENDREIPGLNRIRADLEQVRELGKVSDSMIDFHRFARTVHRVLRSQLQGQSGWGTSVLVAPLDAGIGNAFRTVHIVGMTEGVFPRHARSDPLLPDGLRQSLDRDGSRLPTKNDRLEIERQNFQLALQSAGLRRLYWNRALIGATNESYPSPWFVDEVLKVNDKTGILVKDLMDPKNGMIEPVSTLPELCITETEAASEYEFDLLDVSSQVSEEGDLQVLLADPRNSILASGRKVVASRRSSSFSEHDGHIADGLTRSVEMPSLSASSLQKYATCPYSYFLAYVLDVDERIDPEDALTLSTLERGTIVHAVLEEFFREHAKRGLRGDQQELSVLREVARNEFARYQSKEYIGYNAIFDLEKAQLLRQLEEWHRSASEVLEDHNHEMMVEVPFGNENDKLGWIELEDGTSIRLRGKIDLIAIGTSGVLVMDFKTGRSSSYSDVEKDVTASGTKLQLPIYSIVAQQLLGHEEEVRSAYWFVFQPGSIRLRPRAPIELGTGIERFNDVMGIIVKGIRSGAFPANPGARESRGGSGDVRPPWKNCRHCVYSDICPSNRLIAWGNKNNAVELLEYRELAEGTSA